MMLGDWGEVAAVVNTDCEWPDASAGGLDAWHAVAAEVVGSDADSVSGFVGWCDVAARVEPQPDMGPDQIAAETAALGFAGGLLVYCAHILGASLCCVCFWILFLFMFLFHEICSWYSVNLSCMLVCMLFCLAFFVVFIDIP